MVGTRPPNPHTWPEPSNDVAFHGASLVMCLLCGVSRLRVGNGLGIVPRMQLGIGIDATLDLDFDEQAELVRDSVAAGYSSAWTTSGPITRDGFQVCAQWARVTPPDFGLGIAAIPVPAWRVPSLASQVGTVSEISGGRFVVALAVGPSYLADYRVSHGLRDLPPVGMLRDYLVTVRGLLAGESVTHEGKAVTLRNMQLTTRPIPVPLYLSGLGPQVLRLAGELADGLCLNWSTPEHRLWCRERIAEGAERTGRDPSSVVLMEYIHVCIDEDEALARRTFAEAFLRLALSRSGASKDAGYRGHFARQGFDTMLSELEEQRDAGASMDELADAAPDELLRDMGYWGTASGAPAALDRLTANLDVAVVRIVPARTGLTAAQQTMRACAPSALAT